MNYALLLILIPVWDSCVVTTVIVDMIDTYVRSCTIERENLPIKHLVCDIAQKSMAHIDYSK